MRAGHPSPRAKRFRHREIALARDGTARHEAGVVMAQLNLAAEQWEATPEDVRLALRKHFNQRQIMGAGPISPVKARRIAWHILKSAEKHACAAGELDHALGDMEDALAVCLEQLTHQQAQTVLARQEIKAFHPAQ
jgi:hypothetical protein